MNGALENSGSYSTSPSADGTQVLKEGVKALDLAVLYDLPNLSIRARYIMDGFLSGQHRSSKKGFSVEFAEYRDYQLGDDFRRIDWKLYARTDRLHIKQFEHETQMRAVVVLDVSGSMNYSSQPEKYLKKVDFARTVLAAFGLVTHRQGDALGLAVIGDDLLTYQKPKASGLNWRTFLANLDGLTTGGTTQLAKGLLTLAGVLPKRTLVIIASDFYEDPDSLQEAWRRLNYDHHELVTLQILDGFEIDFDLGLNGTFIDAETGSRLQLNSESAKQRYLQRIQNFLTETETHVREHGGDHYLMRTDRDPLIHLSELIAHREGRL